MSEPDMVWQKWLGFRSSRDLEEDEIDSDEEDEIEKDEFEFDIDGLESCTPKKNIVEVVILETGQIVQVKARFPWCWSWLQIKVELLGKKENDVQQLIDGTFRVLEYQLDPNVGELGISAISLFLNDISEADSNLRHGFCSMLRGLPAESVRLENLNNLVSEEFLSIIHKIEVSQPGQVFLMAVHQPEFFKVASILFPQKIAALTKVPADQDPDTNTFVLENLEKITRESPWKFGFQDIMYRETKFYNLEASYDTISRTAFFKELSELHRSALQQYDMFKSECKAVGHTYLLHDDIPKHWTFYQKSNKKENVHLGNFYPALDFLAEQEVLKREVKGCQERFHMMRYWRAEEGICDSLKTILNMPSSHLPVNLQDEEFRLIQQDSCQMAAARSIIDQPITMVSGRGGTGKTEVVSTVLAAAKCRITIKECTGEEAHNQCDKGEKKQDEVPTVGCILYTAPTGKAASVIKKRVKSEAFTIHQVLASYKVFKKKGSGDWKFNQTRVLAVDECSMVPLEIFNRLLKLLLNESQLNKIVLLGDHLQLPSVDPGNFMEDLYFALEPKGYSVSLKTNHRSEGSLIFENAELISKQKLPMCDKSLGFSLVIPDGESLDQIPSFMRKGTNKLLSTEEKPMDLVGKDISEQKKVLYWTLMRLNKEEYHLLDDEKSQIISFMNNPCSVLNQFGTFIYNHHLMYSIGDRKRKLQFEVGDKIICTKNNDVPIYDEADGLVTVDNRNENNVDSAEEKDTSFQMTTQRLMNGNLYKIRAVSFGHVAEEVESVSHTESHDSNDLKNNSAWTAQINNQISSSEDVDGLVDGQPVPKKKGEKRTKTISYVVLDDLCGEVLRADYSALREKCKMKHAWAISIHKFQGSETDNVVYCLSGIGYETWRHVYTAVTRGKKTVTIVGTFDELKRAVETSPVPRQTALKEKVQRIFAGIQTPSRVIGNQMKDSLLINSAEAPNKRKIVHSKNSQPPKLVKQLF